MRGERTKFNIRKIVGKRTNMNISTCNNRPAIKPCIPATLVSVWDMFTSHSLFYRERHFECDGLIRYFRTDLAARAVMQAHQPVLLHRPKRA